MAVQWNGGFLFFFFGSILYRSNFCLTIEKKNICLDCQIASDFFIGFIHNNVSNLDFIKIKIISLIDTCFLFILHVKIHFMHVSLTKLIFLKSIFLKKSQLKVFF
jgi:hypothetical protein